MSQGQSAISRLLNDPQHRLTPAGLVGNMSSLVSPPAIHLKVLELIRAEGTSVTQIGQLVSQDPNLTARLLRLVNSSFFGLPNKVDTVARAITLIGIRELENLVASVSVVSSFSRVSVGLVNMDTFWRHSLFTALLARSLASRCGLSDPEQLFFAGLLHDLGSLVMYHQLPKPMAELLLLSEGNEQVLYEAEEQQFGFSHADVGALMMEAWNLPVPLRQAVACHHAPHTAGEKKTDAAVVNLAEALANRSQMGAFCESPAEDPPVPAETWSIIGLSATSLDEETLVGEAGLEFADMSSAIMAKVT